MRSYLSDLRVKSKGNESNTFPGKRPFFVYLLPPFAVPEHSSLIKLEVIVYNNLIVTLISDFGVNTGSMFLKLVLIIL